MACSCKKSRASMAGTAPVLNEAPHSVRPGESCIFCAEKHLSTAYVEFNSEHSTGAIIGELELARRHTLLEYPDVSSNIRAVEYAVCLRDFDTAAKLFDAALESATETAGKADPDEESEGPKWETQKYQVVNPFIGEVHLCAAWRLAFEIGYMVPNRYMIIGDLDLATEQLTRFDFGLGTITRDLRHRVQTIRAADLDIAWPDTWGIADKLITSHLKEYTEKYAEGLKTYLGA